MNQIASDADSAFQGQGDAGFGAKPEDKFEKRKQGDG